MSTTLEEKIRIWHKKIQYGKKKIPYRRKNSNNCKKKSSIIGILWFGHLWIKRILKKNLSNGKYRRNIFHATHEKFSSIFPVLLRFFFNIRIELVLGSSGFTCCFLYNLKRWFLCLVNWLSRTSETCFLRFFWTWRYQRRKIHLLKFYFKMKKPLKICEKVTFSITKFFQKKIFENRPVNP